MDKPESLNNSATPFQNYIFHFLPGLPVLVGICIIIYNNIDLCKLRDIIDKLKLSSNGGAGKFFMLTFFLIILILSLSLVFLLGMLVDSIRHLIEEMFLVAKWSECKIPRENSGNDISNLAPKWMLYDEVNESEYYMIEFFGNVAISMAFFWGIVVANKYFNANFYYFMSSIWIFGIFCVRPFFAPVIWKCNKDAEEEMKIIKECSAMSKYKKGFLCARKNVCYRVWDFSATFISISISILILIYFCIKSDLIASHFFIFLIVITITVPFEVYVVRFKRYKELLRMFFLSRPERTYDY